MSPGRYRKRPVVIEAQQFDGSAESAALIVEWASSQSGVIRPDDGPVLRIDTMEGTLTARPGWWVIRGVVGEFYACEPEVFRATYEEAD